MKRDLGHSRALREVIEALAEKLGSHTSPKRSKMGVSAVGRARPSARNALACAKRRRRSASTTNAGTETLRWRPLFVHFYSANAASLTRRSKLRRTARCCAARRSRPMLTSNSERRRPLPTSTMMAALRSSGACEMRLATSAASGTSIRVDSTLGGRVAITI